MTADTRCSAMVYTVTATFVDYGQLTKIQSSTRIPAVTSVLIGGNSALSFTSTVMLRTSFA